MRINQGWERATDHESCLQGESETVSSGASLVVQLLGLHLPMQETQVQSLSQEYPLEKEMATHSSILAWEIPEELEGLQLVGLQSVRYN